MQDYSIVNEPQETLAKALYVINKRAKQLRDLRRIVKDHLFDKGELPLPEELEPLATDSDLYWFFSTDLNLDWHCLLIYDDRCKDWYDILDNLKLYRQELVEFQNECESYLVFKEEDEEIPDEYIWDEYNDEEYDNCIALIDRWYELNEIRKDGHSFLKKSRNEIQKIYELKDYIIITFLNLSPCEIHRFSLDDKHVYPVYTLCGFRFHVQMETKDAKSLIDNLGIAKEIKGEIGSKKSSEITMTYDEALDYILSFIDNDDIDVEDMDPRNDYEYDEYYSSGAMGGQYYGYDDDEYDEY